MPSTATIIADNLRRVRNRMASAVLRAGRSISDVRLVAVTKSATLDWIRELVALGERDLGESRPQQLIERAEMLGDAPRWHLIGSLQRNKVRRLLPHVECIHSVDSFRLLDAIDRIAAESQLRPRVLLEVNISGEQAKHGFSAQELSKGIKTLGDFRNVEVQGLMTMAPLVDDPEVARPVFRGLAEFRQRLVENLPPGIDFRELSMGMSNDFEIAIEEGATMVRIGSDLFSGLDSTVR